MIELTELQVKALAEQESPVQVINPRTKETFFLIPKNEYSQEKTMTERESQSASSGTQKQLPNQAMLEALAQVERIQDGMQPTDVENSLDFLREARSGAMYGYGDD